MEGKVDRNSVFKVSENIVAREIDGEIIIVPLFTGTADLEDELFTMNKTGKAIWKKIDGKNTLKDVSNDLALEFSIPSSKIINDIIGLVKELYERKFLVRIS